MTPGGRRLLLSERLSHREQAERWMKAQADGDIGAAYRRLFDTQDGKVVLQDLLIRRCGFLDTPLVAGDALATGAQIGRLSIAQEIAALMRWSELEILALAHDRTARQIAALEES